MLLGVAVLALAGLAWGSWRNPGFWLSAERRGDHLMAQGNFQDAARTYTDPWRVAVAQYRDGNFKDAAQTFARVPGADGAFDQGNAYLMHGAYQEAMASYDRALGFRPGWQEALDNKALAAARKQVIDGAGADRAEESADAYQPDEVVSDPKGEDQEAKPQDMNGAQMSDAELRASWLRRVQTQPGDFLRAKFAWQAAQQPGAEAPATETGTGGAGP
jgi:Ca-activated chloride channel family protein